MDKYADLSVLLSVYYKEKPEYFSDAINSILNQTVKAKEIVIIKDGPLTEELETLINTYVSRYTNLFKIITLEENLGLGKALALGVENCQYELIARMDTDDICRADRFEKQICEFEHDSELDILGSHILEFDNNIENIISKRILPLDHLDLCCFAKRRNPFNHMTIMYKKKSVLEVGNYEHVIGAEDYFLWIKLIKAGCRTKNIDDFLVYARAGDEMLTRRHGYKYLKNAVLARKKIYELGFNHLIDFVLSCLAISIMSIMPIRIKKQIYYNFLRS